jgi:tRNA threonylcarbamoyladenosine biosynthesis protein TsaE
MPAPRTDVESEADQIVTTPPMSDTPPAEHIRTRSVEDTRALGATLAPLLGPGDVIALAGDLGAGKTAFVQGVARGLGSNDHVASPTFTLVREYEGRLKVLHMDVYRLERIQDVLDLGFDDLLDGGGVLLIEWGDVIQGILPEEHLSVRLTLPDDDDPDLRQIELVGTGRSWAERADAMIEVLSRWRHEHLGRDGER